MYLKLIIHDDNQIIVLPEFEWKNCFSFISVRVTLVVLLV